MKRRSPLRPARVFAAALATLGLSVASDVAFARKVPIPRDVFAPAESIEGNYLSGVVAGAGRDTTAAAIYLREALKADPRNFDLVVRNLETQLAAGNMDEAVALARTVADRDQRNGLARMVLAIDALKQGEWSAAQGLLANRAGGRARGADVTSTLLTGWALAGAKEFDKAIEAVDKLKDDPAFRTFRDYHAGLMADLAGRPADAEKRLRGAYEAAGRGPIRLVQAFASLLARHDKKDEARKLLEDFEQRVSRHPAIRRMRTELEGATPPARLAATAQQGAAEVLFGLGTEGARQGDELAAIMYLRLARHLDPDHDFALVSMADIYERLKLYESAIDTYQEIPETSALAANAQVQVALNLETLKRHDEAIGLLREIVAKEPGDIDAFTSLGNILRAQKRYQDAIAVYSKGIEALGKTEPSHWTIYYFRGSSYERAKDWPKAEADFRKALELRPDQAQVLNYLGYSWVDQKMNLDEAFTMLKRAVELQPRDGYIVDSLGWAYYRLGKYDDAVRELERAVVLRAGDPTINDHLGDAYWHVGRKIEAVFQWNHARDALKLREAENDGLDETEKEELALILKKIEMGYDAAHKAGEAPAEKPKTNGG